MPLLKVVQRISYYVVEEPYFLRYSTPDFRLKKRVDHENPYFAIFTHLHIPEFYIIRRKNECQSIEISTGVFYSKSNLKWTLLKEAVSSMSGFILGLGSIDADVS